MYHWLKTVFYCHTRIYKIIIKYLYILNAKINNLKDNKVGKRFDNENLMQLVILTQVKYNLLNIMLRCFNH